MICRIKILDIISQARYITKGDAIHLLLNRHQDKKMGLFETHFRFQAQLIEQKDCQYCLFIVLTGINLLRNSKHELEYGPIVIG